MTTIARHKQLFRHDPANGVYGDCFRTAIACVLGLKPAEVPHFNDLASSDEEGVEAANVWLAPRGLMLVTVPLTAHSVRQILTYFGALNPGVPYLLVGESRSGVNHNVICMDDRIVHDPSPNRVGIVGPCDDGAYRLQVFAAAPARLADQWNGSGG